ncbi:TIR domain-containing protein [Microbacterium karelineae]|uniref:TIR domain-containing protein n=1 Tax=Microbacterium karelineae TaxID=2654283 RepID=UPI0018D2DD12|nr:nucleotide-binding protein [Microbacterium karelineae]
MPTKHSYVAHRYPDAQFVREVRTIVEALASGGMEETEHITARVTRGLTTWDWDTLDELIQDLDRVRDADVIKIGATVYPKDGAKLLSIPMWMTGRVEVSVEANAGASRVSVTAPTPSETDRLHNKLESFLASATVVERSDTLPQIFVGHGRSNAWRELKEYVQDRMELRTRAFESASRAGHTIRDILDEELSRANLAIIVMTAEDEQGDGERRARQNVIHEAGLFQGKLGFDRVLMLVEDGVENFSNVAGLQYIPFARGNIREALGDVAVAIKERFVL